MCWKCKDIDKIIQHYCDLQSRITDKQSLKEIDILIAKLEADKKALHPDGLTPG
jgi:hypothetical protein